jgi:hypothetical protein
MIRVLGDSDGRHRLEDESGRDVGWIRGLAIGLRGLDDERHAMAAVRATWPVLVAALRRHYFGFPAHDIGRAALRLVHDGAYEWVSDRQRPLARLHRPREGESDGAVAIEFVLPSYANEGVVISVAQVIATALQSFLARADMGASHASPPQPAILGA